MRRILFLCLVFPFVTNSVIHNEIYDDSKETDVDFSEELSDAPEFFSTIQMIEMDGYTAENHYVTTSDGYILNLHRIPHGKSGKKNGKVVYLQHGVLTASHDWIIAGPGKGLGYILSEAGYDVWLANVRGNTYSRNHTTLNPDKDSDFWQFSWHQIGEIDLPTIIDYILEKTGVDGVYYCGHSQGTTAFYVMATMKPEYNSKIKAYVHLAPIAFMNHMTSPLLKFVSIFEGTVSALLDLIGMDEFLPSHGILSQITAEICSVGIGEELCKNTLFLLCGFSNEEMNNTLLPTIMVHVPSGAATKQMLHYAQEIKSGHFRQYDFGFIENMKIYGQRAPPDYDLSLVTANGYLIYSKNDWLAAEQDVERLYNKIKTNCHGKFLVAENHFNHLDFVYGINAPQFIYTKVVSLFSKH